MAHAALKKQQFKGLSVTGSSITKFALLTTLGLLVASCTTPSTAADSCPSLGAWSTPANASHLTQRQAIEELSERRIVLLGESHDNAAHHRWQLATIAALHAKGGPLALGFEMFPRSAQPVLDEWVEGRLGEKEFLEKVQWERVWRFDSSLYMPIFHFARQHRLPMVALNVDHELIRKVRKEGWNNVPASVRQGVTDPAPPPPGYIKVLTDIFEQHSSSHNETEEKKTAIGRFIDAQLTWDRAMAEAALKGAEKGRLIAIIGAGHLANKFGVPHQLTALGQTDVATVIPVNQEDGCKDITPQFADLVFGVDTFERPPMPYKPLLGIMLDDKEGSVRVGQVLKNSVAKETGIKLDDLIVKAAGQPITNNKDLIEIIRRQAPGTWLPLIVQRDKQTLELVAKFPSLDELHKKAHTDPHK